MLLLVVAFIADFVVAVVVAAGVSDGAVAAI